MQIINLVKTLLSWISLNVSLQKALCFIVLVICVLYLRRATIIDRRVSNILPSHSLRNAAHSLKDAVEKSQHPGKKIFIALDYWEQLSRATSNLVDLTALAAYGGRQVVVPFVRNSKFHGAPTEQEFETLELYYNVSALNRTLRSRGHGTLISWEEFQDVCQGKLDVLVHLDFHRLSQTKTYNATTRAFFPCNDARLFGSEFTVESTICMNVFAVTSVEKLENEVIKGRPCVGFDQWKGSQQRNIFRSQFELKPLVKSLMQYRSTAVFFNPKLLHLAQDFITKKLGPLFVSVHVRAERILTAYHGNFAMVVKCLSNLVKQVQGLKRGSRASMPIFLATDFADYGSWSKSVNPARENAESLMKILAPLNSVMFQPSVYNLTDRGSVAIVEMSIMVSGKHLSVVGGGQFQYWTVSQFVSKNTKYRIFSGCSRVCSWECHF